MRREAHDDDQPVMAAEELFDFLADLTMVGRWALVALALGVLCLAAAAALQGATP